uniref:Uncharacterized protein n=1 Tax=Anguilla anguilla TaxID=7936 RepID=A0A0E9Q9W1_ANGAN
MGQITEFGIPRLSSDMSVTKTYYGLEVSSLNAQVDCCGPEQI